MNWPRRVSHLTRGLQLPGVLSFNSGFQLVRGTLLNHLYQTRNSLATDPRDKIIGLLGLIPDEESWNMLIDYNASVEVIYLGAACLFGSEEKSLRILSAVESPRADVIQKHLPEQTKVVELGIGRNYSEPFDAEDSPAFVSVIDKQYLLATGIRLDQVKSIGVVYSSKSRSHATVSKDWGRFFELGDGRFKFKTDYDGQRLVQSSFEATVTAAPPSSLQRDTVDSCRNWKCDGGKKLIARCLSTVIKGTKSAVCEGRRLFETQSGLLGLGPEGMEEGDCIVVLLGGPVPYVLRSEGERYRFVGECYILGAMGGEALSHLGDELEAMGHQLGPCGAPICDAKLEKFMIL